MLLKKLGLNLSEYHIDNVCILVRNWILIQQSSEMNIEKKFSQVEKTLDIH